MRRQLSTLNSDEMVFFTSWPCRMALSVANFLISRMAVSVQPPRFSTAIGRKVIPAARTASPTWFSFLLWASLAAWPGSSAPRSMESLLRAAVTVTSKHKSCPFVPAKGISRSAGRLSRPGSRNRASLLGSLAPWLLTVYFYRCYKHGNK